MHCKPTIHLFLFLSFFESEEKNDAIMEQHMLNCSKPCNISLKFTMHDAQNSKEKLDKKFHISLCRDKQLGHIVAWKQATLLEKNTHCLESFCVKCN